MSKMRFLSPWRVFLAVLLVLLMGLGLAGFRLFHQRAPLSSDASASTEPPDPRRAYDGPYRNIHPDVRYVGDAQCLDCHHDIAQSYARHPMGRSLLPVGAMLDRQGYTADTNNPFDVLGRRFTVERQGKRLWHRQALLDDSGKPLVELSQEVHWVIGSGAKGHSYLFARDGYVFQTPISWFTQQQRWDLSPGFGPEILAGRPVLASCLFCHANGIQEHPEQPDRLVPPTGETPDPPLHLQAIGCERCHGPGQRHVQSADRWDIVNPEHLPPPLRDAVCEQCHLEGEARLVRGGRKLFDYRPGLPLHDFWAVLVQDRQDGEDAKAVNHVEQMYQSKCFSHPVDGVQLGCTTCHDPHVAIAAAQRQSYYRGKCLTCHDEAKEQQGCSEPLPRRRLMSPEDSCIDCHMPHYRTSDIPHTASTDHRILRRPVGPASRRSVGPASRRSPAGPPDLEGVALVDFYRDRFPEGDPQTERTLGLGLLKIMDANKLQSSRHADRALRFLESALGRDPSDSSVRQGKVEAYLLLNQPAKALSEAEVLLPEQPGNWQLLIQAAYAAESDGQKDRARDYWRRAVRINPFVADYQVHLLELLLRAGQLDEARKHCRQLLRVDPFNVSGRQARVGFLLQEGKREEARREFAIIRQLKPPDLTQRQEWFQQQLSEPLPHGRGIGSRE